MIDTATSDDKARKLMNKLDALKRIRSDYESMIDKIIGFVSPGRRKITDTESNRGKRTGDDIYDGTAVSAKNLLVDGMCGYMCARSLRWLSLKIPHKINFPRHSSMRQWSDKRLDQYPEVRRWLASYEDVIYDSFNYGNYYDVMPEFVSDCVSIGTVTKFRELDAKSGKTIYTVPHFRECYIAENAYGVVDTLFRECSFTLKQLVEKFSMETLKNIDVNFEHAYNLNPYAERSVLHAIFPREDRLTGSDLGKDKPIASVWVYKSPVKLLLESGFDYPVFTTWRWRKNVGEPYGYGPGWDAFVDIALANQQGRTNLVTGQKIADPPMVGHSDLRGKVQSGPKGWTYVENIERHMPQQLYKQLNVPFTIELQDRTDKAIREHFHTNFFLMLYQAAFNKVDLTATQVLGMQGEQAAVIGTRVGRMESEALDPDVEGEAEIQLREGRVPPPPQILLDVPARISVEYMGPLSQAQRRLHKTRSIQAGVQIVGGIMTVVPEAGDSVDWDEVVKESLDATGFPVTCLRGEKEVENIRRRRAEAQKLQQTADALPKFAKAAAQAGKGAEENSILEKLMNEGAQA